MGVIFATDGLRFRGGPMHYARSRGVENSVSRLEELKQAYGLPLYPRWVQSLAETHQKYSPHADKMAHDIYSRRRGREIRLALRCLWQARHIGQLL